MSTYRTFSTRRTSQSQPIPGKDMARNNAGGYAFAVNDWTRLDRFLVLGSEGGTYYVQEQGLTRRNAEAVLRCIQADGLRTVACIAEVSEVGRAPKNDPALFALAMALKLGNLETRQAAVAALPRVARIGTHLFHFAQYVEQFGGWGRLTRRAVADWYNAKDAGRLVYQAVKYQRRDDWSHRDLLRLSHPKPPSEQHKAIYHWVTQGWESIGPDPHPDEALRLIWAFERAKVADEHETVRLINEYGLTREMVQTRHLNSVPVWAALLEKMPLMAMVRNLGKMTEVGLLKPLSRSMAVVVHRLRDQEYLRKSRVHPLSVLVALKTYQQGHGMRGSLRWSPVASIVDALDDAFYLSFGNVEPTGKRWMLALDVSGSMGGSLAGMPLTCREGAAAMALVTARVEPQHVFTIFSSAGSGYSGMKTGRGWLAQENGISTWDISPRQRLDDVVRRTTGLPFGGTDCALPMLYALERGLEVDVFAVYTDSETWAGSVHPAQALREYRRKTGIPAKLVVVGMVSNGFSIADPDDAGMLDVVGFSTATPNVISGFAVG